MQVDTLGESVDHESYERTRASYRGTGFRDSESVMTDNPGTPERPEVTSAVRRGTDRTQVEVVRRTSMVGGSRISRQRGALSSAGQNLLR